MKRISVLGLVLLALVFCFCESLSADLGVRYNKIRIAKVEIEERKFIGCISDRKAAEEEYGKPAYLIKAQYYIDADRTTKKSYGSVVIKGREFLYLSKEENVILHKLLSKLVEEIQEEWNIKNIVYHPSGLIWED